MMQLLDGLALKLFNQIKESYQERWRSISLSRFGLLDLEFKSADGKEERERETLASLVLGRNSILKLIGIGNSLH